jgi:hypothetical protein
VIRQELFGLKSLLLTCCIGILELRSHRLMGDSEVAGDAAQTLTLSSRHQFGQLLLGNAAVPGPGGIPPATASCA